LIGWTRRDQQHANQLLMIEEILGPDGLDRLSEYLTKGSKRQRARPDPAISVAADPANPRSSPLSASRAPWCDDAGGLRDCDYAVPAAAAPFNRPAH
jgi:hypothetical protein